MFLILAMICCIIGGIPAQERCGDALDLNKAKISYPAILEKWGVTGEVSGGSGDLVEPRPRLEIVLNLDRLSYSMGADFKYTIRVTNISDKSLNIPWQLDGDKVLNGYNLPPYGFVHACIYLEAARNETVKRSIVEINLFGSEERTTSLKTLQPGQCAIIKGTARWDDESSIASNIEKRTLLNVRAEWVFLRGMDNTTYYKRASSSSSIQVEIINPEK